MLCNITIITGRFGFRVTIVKPDGLTMTFTVQPGTTKPELMAEIAKRLVELDA